MESPKKQSQSSIINMRNSQNLTQSSQQTINTPVNNLEKGRQTRFYFEKVLHHGYCLLIFSIINIVLSIFYYDADYTQKQKISAFCLYTIFAILPIQIITIIYRYKAILQLQIRQKILDPEINTFSDRNRDNFPSTIFLYQCTIMTENIYDGFFFEYKVNYILVILSFLKIFIIIRVILLNNIYMTPRSNRLCRMYGCSFDYIYAIKCLFKDSPIFLIGFVFTFSVFIFAISLRIAERNVTTEYPSYFGKQYIGDIENFQNALWLTIITMTTTGYGDFYPRTFFGRIIDVILVIWGTFIVSLMVVVLTNTLNMDQSQKRALIVLDRLQAKKSLKQSAAFLITHTCRKHLIKKKIALNLRPKLTEEENGKIQASFHKYLIHFQNIRRKIRSMYEMDDIYEEMTRQFEFINDEVSFLISSQEETINSIKNYLDIDNNISSPSENQEQQMMEKIQQ